MLPFHAHGYDFKTSKFDITSMYSEGPMVVMEFTVNAIIGRERPYPGVKYVSFVRVEDGKIKSAREYTDTLKAKTDHFD